MKKLTPFLWFDTQAEEAAKFYVSVFKNSKITNVMRQGPKGPVMTVSFNLDGNDFVALNGAAGHAKFSEAISFLVPCKDQKEINYYWKKLTSGGGKPSMCGWLADKFGVSWQVIPDGLGKLISNPGGMQAMLKMQKLDIKALKAAAKA